MKKSHVMIKLEKVTIHKYKSFENDQSFEVEDNVTILVGMNESGKTSVLESIAKTNYFEKDEDFVFNLTHDYPRAEKKKIDKAGEDPNAITLYYTLTDALIKNIENDLGKGVLVNNEFSRSTKFSNNTQVALKTNFEIFIKNKIAELTLPNNLDYNSLKSFQSKTKFEELIAAQTDEEIKEKLEQIRKYFDNIWQWQLDPIGEYVTRIHLTPNLPKFLYYDEYYSLPSRISITELQQGKLKSEDSKTAKALFELADINIDEILNSSSFESYKAELEATEAIISDELFKYWKTNTNLSIEFEIDKIIKKDHNNHNISDYILDIRVKNSRARISLPLRNRSKGFNWFFSFLVWFKKIQEDKDSTYILLLDEPGLNLHASAQGDLLNFFKDLSKDYQILYSTHSPFMIEPDELHNIRTVLETRDGSKISDSIQEKDPNTLFPLQAALGYNIAQNLFISKHNLLVEGTSDLVYLQVMSSILENSGRKFLDEKITIVPVGGLDKVATFVSLLRSNNLNIVCLLDTFKDAKGKAKLENLVEQKIINQKKIKFFNEFLTGYAAADIEDLFTKQDYLKIYNEAFSNNKVEIKDLNPSIEQIIIQITQILGIDRFNHFKPANILAKKGVDEKFFDKETLDNFEKMIIEINKLF